jgi:hypothetical protein
VPLSGQLKLNEWILSWFRLAAFQGIEELKKDSEKCKNFFHQEVFSVHRC